MITSKAKRISRIFTLLYFASYLTRIGFTVMLVKIGSDLGLNPDTTKSSLAIVLTALTVTYGIGQIINGILGDKISPKFLIGSGLAVASVCNVLIAVVHSIPFMAVIWGINGFAQSMMWPPIVRLMSENLNQEEYSYGMVRVSWGSSFATVLLYLTSPLLLSIISWKTIFIILAFAVLFVDLYWILSGQHCVNSHPNNSLQKSVLNKKIPKETILPFGLIMLAIIAQGMLRDGVTDWMPYLLTETFRIPPEQSIFATVILSMFSILSFFVTDFLNRKTFHEETSFSAIIFCVAALSAFFMLLFHQKSNIALTLLCSAIIVAAMHGINLMLITVVPKRFVGTGKISTVSGILNACTYLGSAISTYLFARITELKGWSSTFGLWLIISFFGAVFCILAIKPWKKVKNSI